MTNPPITCSTCGFGELLWFAGDKYFTSGYYYVCDCGYSEGMKPKMSFDQFCVLIGDTRSAIKTIRERLAFIDTHIPKLQKRHQDSIIRWLDKTGNKNIHGNDNAGYAPKSHAEHQALSHEKTNLLAQETALRGQWSALVNVYPDYARRYQCEAVQLPLFAL